MRPVEGQIDDLLGEIHKETDKGNKVLVTTLTKRMAEELTDYMREVGIRVKYLHSDIDTLERIEIVRDLRMGVFDVLVGINLLREGLDIPEITLVAILDADKEGFLRSERSLIQTIGRAARNENGRVILFAKKITASMQFAIDETNRRRKLQEEFNKEHNITPKSTKRKLDENLKLEEYDDVAWKKQKLEKMPAAERKKILIELNARMKKAAQDLNFEEAIRLRDEIAKIKEI